MKTRTDGPVKERKDGQTIGSQELDGIGKQLRERVQAD